MLTGQEEYDDAIAAWKESIALQPESADAHTSTSPPRLRATPTWPHAHADLASAYIVSPVSRPDLALHHLQCVFPSFPPPFFSLTELPP